MKPQRVVTAAILCGISGAAFAEHTMAELPGVLALAFGLVLYVRAWGLLYLALAVLAVALPARLVLHGLPRSAPGSRRGKVMGWCTYIVHNLFVYAGLAALACALGIGIGLATGLKAVSPQEVIHLLKLDKPPVQTHQMTRAEIKAEQDAKLKVKDDLSWQEYSPLKRPWPEYEGALYTTDAKLANAPYALEIFIGGKPTHGWLIKVCELDNAGPCDGPVAYILNSANYRFSKLFEGRYCLHILNLATGQALESREERLDANRPPLNSVPRFDLTKLAGGDFSGYKEIPLAQF